VYLQESEERTGRGDSVRLLTVDVCGSEAGRITR
jgi:hypothetical protein